MECTTGEPEPIDEGRPGGTGDRLRHNPQGVETMLDKFCHSLRTAIANAVATGITEGIARGFGLASGETFEPAAKPAAIEPPKPTAKRKTK